MAKITHRPIFIEVPTEHRELFDMIKSSSQHGRYDVAVHFTDPQAWDNHVGLVEKVIEDFRSKSALPTRDSEAYLLDRRLNMYGFHIEKADYHHTDQVVKYSFRR